MPVVSKSSYSCPWWLRNAHAATIVPSLIRKVESPLYSRERIITPDQDFLDLDWLEKGNRELIIISHGLEGSSNRTYIRGLAQLALKRKIDVLAWNCRSCSGEMNNLPRFYHHGDSEDLSTVIEHVLVTRSHESIYLVGFSMGGSMTAKYLGEGRGTSISSHLKGGAAISTPFDLLGSAKKLDGPGMGFYRNRFLKKLGEKIELKSYKWPELFDTHGYKNVSSFRQFDNRYTAPLHGFADADEFYRTASAGQHLDGIRIPFLIINALNDPFLTPECFPYKVAESNPFVHLETPSMGGHVGFMSAKSKPTWSEMRLMNFFSSL